MTSQSSRDLGHGVRVMPGDGGRIVVLSADFDLGWRRQSGDLPGSAVLWEDSSFEVVDREPWRRGDRWTLQPWGGEAVMRGVLPLDQESVSAAAEVSRRAARTTGLRPLLWLFSPVLGFAIAPWQSRWRDDWGFPAMLATWVSAILEVVVGTACVMEIVVSLGAGASIFPWLPRPLVYFGFYLFVEGLVRLAQVFADTEPVGTFFGLCAAVLEARPPPVREPVPAPKVEVFDEAGGALELVSPIHRRDWEDPGLLRYRGGRYVLDSTRRLGESWVYGFLRVEAGDHSSAPNLRLLPPRAKVEAPPRDRSRGVVETVLLSIACTLAPRRFQERWGWQVGLRPMWFTLMGASAELIGGLSNLGAEGEMDPFALLLNLFFVFEAAARFASLVLKGLPLGSVIGLPLAPILERYLPEPVPPSDGLPSG